jgi:serine phosphatase RsbU (regulator of sigma subunit)
MLFSMLPRRLSISAALLCLALVAVPAHFAAQTTPAALQPAVLQIDGLGKGTAPLDGPWQFHIGDDPSYALPQTSDSIGINGWEQLNADKTWGAQGHPSYAGYAWYRKHLHFSPAPGASPQFFLLILKIDDAYEVYWNGQLMGHNGTLPPHPSYPFAQSAQIFNLGQPRDGVLAVRVWKAPLESFDSDLLGGFNAAPLAGSFQAITDRKAAGDYLWLQNRQYYFALRALYALVMVLSLLGWLRDRSQRVLLAMAAFSGSPFIAMFLTTLRLPISHNVGLGWLQPVLSLQDVGLWYLLLYLLQLDSNRRLARATLVLAVVSFTATSLDGALTLVDWSNPLLTAWAQWADGILTAIFTVTQMYPWVLLAFGIRKRLDSARWLVAITALLTETLFFTRIALDQGSRFTHWTLGSTLAKPLFYLNGNGFPPQTITDTLLLIAIIYAVYRYMQESHRRQGALEQELKSARELQQVLIPETLPELPGFAVTSAYRPAQEVGGDFFQIIPLDGQFKGSTLILLGDVSGKGLRAAMAVSLIVGTVRTLAKFLPRPAEVLAELNERLCGRLQGGFTTCLALRLDPDGHCTVASAGHPAPFLNKREIELPGSLPLGVVPGRTYEESSFVVREGDHLALYTDGLLEARNAKGEIFSFERLDALFSTFPDAAKATDAAVHFGQDDDITVLTLRKVAAGQESTTQLTAPHLAPAL